MAGYSRDEGAASTQVDEMLNRMQLEALHPRRIDRVKTSDFKENKRDYVPSALIQRRVDEAGTEENRAVQGEGRQKLAAWNSAWTALQDDGTANDDLTNVNEGLGQTHRGKLQADDSVRDYTGEEYNYRGGYGGARGGRHGIRVGGRGGGSVGRAQGGGRPAAIERPAPIKRFRVVKGSGLSHAPSVQAPVNLSTISSRQAATPTPPRRSKSPLKQISRTRPVVSTTSLQRASITSSKVFDLKPPVKAATYEGSLATPDDFMANILRKKQPVAISPDISKAQVRDTTTPEPLTIANNLSFTKPGVVDVLPKAVAVTNGSHSTKAQVGDVPLKAITVTGDPHISKPQLQDITLKIVPSGPHKAAPAALPTNQTDLLDVEIGEEGPHQGVIGFTHSADSKVENGTTSFDPSASSHGYRQQLPTPKNSQLLRNIEALETLGGLSIEQLGLLQTLKSQVQARELGQEPGASTSNETSVTTIDEPKSQPAKINTTLRESPIVVASLTKAEPQESIAKKLVAQRATIIGEHVHRSRFQHSALVEKFQNLKISDNSTSKLAEVKADVVSTTNPFGSAKTAVRQQSGSGPSLPAHLAHLSPVTDAGAAVRAQYGSSNTPSHDSGGANALTGPTLPAHLASLAPVTDAGAAIRAQYNPPGLTSRGRGILNPVSNGQLRLFPSDDSMTFAPSSAPPPRTSMLNKTGFIGQAENRAQAKKSDDPLLLARKRGI